MGQLERYGLYVLCVVIVLILGVAIWGGDPAAARTTVPETAALDGGDPGRGANEQGGPLSLPEDGERFFSHVAEDDSLASFRPVAELGEAVPPTIDAWMGDDDGSAEQGGEDASARQSAPARAKTYTVKRGDNFALIARRVLGSERHTAAIARANPDVDPRRLKIGTVLQLPAVSQPAPAPRRGRAAAPSSGWTEYTVRAGDNPSKISLRVYGTALHADKIMAANSITDPRKLQPKVVLRIPPL